MDDPETPPLEFANQVIEMLGNHLLGDKAKLGRGGFRVIRLVFRRLGGSWQQVCTGSPRHMNLLIECVKAWGSQSR